jgi:hypothetical protein
MISIGILSHFAPKTLNHTLETYKISGLLDITDDIFCIIQKSTRQEKEIEVCKNFGIRYIAMPDNGMMASGFKAIYENAKYELILFLENDFCTFCSIEDIKNYINNAIYYISSGKADIIRGRSRANPGKPNFALGLQTIPATEFVNHTHLSECMYWIQEPEKTYPTKISRIDPIQPGQNWYITTTQSCNYTNNPFICSKEFFKNAIYPYLEFGSNIESKITDLWSKNEYKCIFGFGIFTHYRSFDGHR